jgi:uncharacterized protein DUF4129
VAVGIHRYGDEVTAAGRRTAIVTMTGLLVAFLLVWSAGTGPTGLAEGVPDGPVVHQGPSRTEQTQQRERARPATDVATAHDQRYRGQWLHDLAGLTALLIGLWFVGMLLRALVDLVGPKLPDKQLVVDLDPLPDAGAGREALARDRERHLAALTSNDVRNGIVACWVLMEQGAAEAGVVRRPAETSTEFVVRFLHALDLDPRPVAELAGLYHEARFSTHTLDEDARSRALAALRAIHDELAHLGASR